MFRMMNESSSSQGKACHGTVHHSGTSVTCHTSCKPLKVLDTYNKPPEAHTLACAAGGAGGGTTLTALRKADEAWKRLRTAEVHPHTEDSCCSFTSTRNLHAAWHQRGAMHTPLGLAALWRAHLLGSHWQDKGRGSALSWAEGLWGKVFPNGTM